MPLTWEGGQQAPVLPTMHGCMMTLYPAFDVITGLPSVDQVEISRSTDAAGTGEVTIARLPPLPARGQVYIDERANDTTIWFYSHRHVKADGAWPGAGYGPALGWSPRQAFAVQVVVPGDLRLSHPPAGTASGANTGSRYRCSLFNSGSQVVGTGGAGTALLFDSETDDVGNLHDTSISTSHVTIPAVNYRGVWIFIGQASFAANATGVRHLFINKNAVALPGSATLRTVVSAASTEIMNSLGYAVDPAPGDYFELMAFQTSGGNLNVSALFNAVHVW